jgi:hypothetical protein
MTTATLTNPMNPKHNNVAHGVDVFSGVAPVTASRTTPRSGRVSRRGRWPEL